MAKTVVRDSKFRHVFGTANRNDACFTALHVTEKNLESNLATVNPKYFAFINQTRGGGSATVLKLTSFGRLKADTPVLIVNHKETITDLEFSPFHDDLLASCSEDGLVKLWKIPTGNEEKEEMATTLSGHKRKVILLKWNPVTDFILLSAAADGNIIVWDLMNAQNPLFRSIEHVSIGNVCSLSWNFDGSLFAFTDKSKGFKIVDPRKNEVVKESTDFNELFKNAKPSRCAFVTGDRIIVFGFNHQANRIWALYDAKTMEKLNDSDDACGQIGQMEIYYDEDTSILFKSARGETQIGYYEINDKYPFVHFLTLYSSASQGQRGGCWMPKRGLNVHKCEIARFYKLTADKCEPTSFFVPRKSDLFQDDIYPDFCSDEPALTAEEWEAGKNALPRRAAWLPYYEALKNDTAAPTSQSTFKPIKLTSRPTHPTAAPHAENGVSLPPGINFAEMLDDIKKLKATVRKNVKRISKLEKQLGEAMADGDQQEEEEEE